MIRIAAGNSVQPMKTHHRIFLKMVDGGIKAVIPRSDNAVRLQLDPPPGVRQASSLVGPDWIRR
jgi:hypothetical protein